jgi:hypothetical protein
MLNVACSTAENINLAFYQNAVPIVSELSVGNPSDTPVSWGRGSSVVGAGLRLTRGLADR